MTPPTPAPDATARKRDLRAYYYAFEHTGDDAIDAILEAVADAGHAYHHTDEWSDNGYIEKIQQAAHVAALSRDAAAPLTPEADITIITSRAYEQLATGNHFVCTGFDFNRNQVNLSDGVKITIWDINTFRKQFQRLMLPPPPAPEET